MIVVVFVTMGWTSLRMRDEVGVEAGVGVGVDSACSACLLFEVKDENVDDEDGDAEKDVPRPETALISIMEGLEPVSGLDPVGAEVLLLLLLFAKTVEVMVP